MFIINAIRLASYILAFAVLAVIWYFFDETLEWMFGQAAAASAVMAGGLAGLLNADKNWVETIFSERLHTERFLVYFPFMFIWFVVLLACFRQEISSNAMRLIVIFALAHLILTISWVVFTDGTKAWYEINAKWISSWLRSRGYGRAVFPLVTVGQVQSLFVTLEVAIAIAFTAIAFSRWPGFRYLSR